MLACVQTKWRKDLAAAALDGFEAAVRQAERNETVTDLRDCEARSDMPTVWHEAVRWAIKIIGERGLRRSGAAPQEPAE